MFTFSFHLLKESWSLVILLRKLDYLKVRNLFLGLIFLSIINIIAESIMPTIDNVSKLLNDIGVADKWENIGCKLRVSQGTLDDISATGFPPELSLKKMIKKAITKIDDWSVLRAAVENSVGHAKAEELMIKLDEM